MLGMLANFFKILNSEASPWQIALAFSFGLIVGLTPFFSIHNVFVFLLVMLIRVNLSSFFLSMGFFALLAYAIDPLSLQIGEALLTSSGLQGTWTSLYQSDFWRISKFNHTLLLGSLVVSVAAFVPVFIGSVTIIKLYRVRFMAWFEKLRVVKFLKASRFYKIYQSVAG